MSFQGRNARKVFRPTEYGSEWWNHDMAFLDFGDDISEVFVPLQNRHQQSVASFIIVGYGVTDLYGQSLPLKGDLEKQT